MELCSGRVELGGGRVGGLDGVGGEGVKKFRMSGEMLLVLGASFTTLMVWWYRWQ